MGYKNQSYLSTKGYDQSNWGLLHRRWILYQLNCQGKPSIKIRDKHLKGKRREREHEWMNDWIQSPNSSDCEQEDQLNKDSKET